jgi:hypothetical protein
VRAIIPEFIEIGIDVLNPVQPKAAMMEPWRIKRDFGDALSFLGGFDIQELLPFGTPAQIRDGARDLIEAYATGGGFIFSPRADHRGAAREHRRQMNGALAAAGYPLAASRQEPAAPTD